MDFLSHLFLPLIVVYVLRVEWLEQPWRFGLVGFTLLPDFDKFLGVPGLLHSAVILLPLTLVILGFERLVRGAFLVSPLIVLFIWSHIPLDIIDGGPVPLLFPFVTTGIGLQYPVQTVFGEGPFGVWLQGPLVTLRTAVPRSGHNTYGFIQGYGVASALLFLTILVDQVNMVNR